MATDADGNEIGIWDVVTDDGEELLMVLGFPHNEALRTPKSQNRLTPRVATTIVLEQSDSYTLRNTDRDGYDRDTWLNEVRAELEWSKLDHIMNVGWTRDNEVVVYGYAETPRCCSDKPVDVGMVGNGHPPPDGNGVSEHGAVCEDCGKLFPEQVLLITGTNSGRTEPGDYEEVGYHFLPYPTQLAQKCLDVHDLPHYRDAVQAGDQLEEMAVALALARPVDDFVGRKMSVVTGSDVHPYAQLLSDAMMEVYANRHGADQAFAQTFGDALSENPMYASRHGGDHPDPAGPPAFGFVAGDSDWGTWGQEHPIVAWQPWIIAHSGEQAAEGEYSRASFTGDPDWSKDVAVTLGTHDPYGEWHEWGTIVMSNWLTMRQFHRSDEFNEIHRKRKKTMQSLGLSETPEMDELVKQTVHDKWSVADMSA